MNPAAHSMLFLPHSIPRSPIRLGTLGLVYVAVRLCVRNAAYDNGILLSIRLGL